MARQDTTIQSYIRLDQETQDKTKQHNIRLDRANINQDKMT